MPVLALHLGLVVLTAAAADWTAVRLDPPEIHLAGLGASQRFIISGVSPTGDEWDLTPQCQVRSDHSDVAAVQSASIVAKSSGEAKIVVTCGGASAAATVRVGRGSAAPEVNFSPDIMSILTVKSCNSSSCHGSPAGQNAGPARQDFRNRGGGAAAPSQAEVNRTICRAGSTSAAASRRRLQPVCRVPDN